MRGVQLIDFSSTHRLSAHCILSLKVIALKTDNRNRSFYYLISIINFTICSNHESVGHWSSSERRRAQESGLIYYLLLGFSSCTLQNSYNSAIFLLSVKPFKNLSCR